MDRDTQIVRMTKRLRRLNAEFKERQEESRCNQLLEKLLTENKRTNELLKHLVEGLTSHEVGVDKDA